MKLLSSLLSAIIRVLFYIAVLSGVVMAGMILLSAILRYVINEPLSFSDELAGLLFVTLGFFSFPYVMEKSEHINLAVLVERLSPAKQKVCRFLASMIFFSFSITFIYQSWNFVDFSRVLSSRTDVAHLLLWPWMAVMPISMTLCALVELRFLYRLLTGKDVPVEGGLL